MTASVAVRATVLAQSDYCAKAVAPWTACSKRNDATSILLGGAIIGTAIGGAIIGREHWPSHCTTD